ncbi:cupin domain-containing protein [Polaribacter aestuariivivens]|uniref:Cupin domain-containing protein n=1 Tax=Polaribacter aestuariivivens TaxID=2304626 RepID=A0A5S3N4D6_9FLAO|nr:cupin domain-containing protein [Polaribacter aestuariivivens]TMM30017.1 cupin domain-containing protein [Polaribacter aestuariivivens]
MNTTEINKKGNWDSFWTEDLKEALKKAEKNEIVGEHLVLENDIFKVWNIQLLAGKSLPFHKHSKPYFYTAITSGKSRSFYSDGKIVDTEYKKNDIRYFNNLSESNYFIHNLENIGTTTLLFTTVEFKK